MSQVDLEALERLLGEGTAGEWAQAHHIGVPKAIVAKAAPLTSLLCIYSDAENEGLAAIDRVEDARLIVAAVNALPALLEEVRAGREARADDLRAGGWTVAVHNDYRLNGEPHTFWLLTKDGRAVKGEGRTDADALNAIRAALASPSVPQEPDTCPEEGCVLQADHEEPCDTGDPWPQEKVQEAQEAGPSGGENRPLVCPHCGVEFVTADPSMLIVSCPSEAGAKAREGIHPAWLAAALKDSLSIGAHLLRSKAVPVLADGRAIPPPAPPVLGAAQEPMPVRSDAAWLLRDAPAAAPGKAAPKQGASRPEKEGASRPEEDNDGSQSEVQGPQRHGPDGLDAPGNEGGTESGLRRERGEQGVLRGDAERVDQPHDPEPGGGAVVQAEHGSLRGLHGGAVATPGAVSQQPGAAPATGHLAEGPPGSAAAPAPGDAGEAALLRYWLVRAYAAHQREGWEEGPSQEETFSRISDVLWNLGLDPTVNPAAFNTLLGQPERTSTERALPTPRSDK